MVDFSYLTGNAPQPASYKAPDMAAQLYQMLGNLPNDAFQAQQQKRLQAVQASTDPFEEQQRARTTALQQPVAGQNGQSPGINDILSAAMQRGGLQEALQLLPTLQKQPFLDQLLKQNGGAGGSGGQPEGAPQQPPPGPNNTSTLQAPAAFHAANERQAANDESPSVRQGGVTRLADDNERVAGDEMKARRVKSESVRKQVEREDEKIAPGDRFGGTSNLVPRGSDPLKYVEALEKRAEAMRQQSALKSAVGISTKADEDQAAAYDKKASEIRAELSKTTEQKNVDSGAAKKAAQDAADVRYYDTLGKGIVGSGTMAAAQKQNIDALRQIRAQPGFTPGFGSDAILKMQRMAAQLGVRQASAAPRELFDQVSAKILANQFDAMKSMASELGESASRVFKPMLDIEEKANITHADSLAGIDAKINMMDKSGDLLMKWADMADDYRIKHGALDAGFNKEMRSEVAKARLGDLFPKEEAKPPPVEGARKANDGKWYVSDPKRPGKYLQVQ